MFAHVGPRALLDVGVEVVVPALAALLRVAAAAEAGRDQRPAVGAEQAHELAQARVWGRKATWGQGEIWREGAGARGGGGAHLHQPPTRASRRQDLHEPSFPHDKLRGHDGLTNVANSTTCTNYHPPNFGPKMEGARPCAGPFWSPGPDISEPFAPLVALSCGRRGAPARDGREPQTSQATLAGAHAAAAQ